jgi:hypothetical protein
MTNLEYVNGVIAELAKCLNDLLDDNIGLIEQINAFAKMDLDEFALWKHRLKYGNSEHNVCKDFEAGDFVVDGYGKILICAQKGKDISVFLGLSHDILGIEEHESNELYYKINQEEAMGHL